jgi:hypothetical protein
MVTVAPGLADTGEKLVIVGALAPEGITTFCVTEAVGDPLRLTVRQVNA